MRLIPTTLAVSVSVSLVVDHVKASTNWEQLESKLSEDSFQVSKVDDWLEQCIHPFKNTIFDPVTNYQLFEQPSGLCQAHASCGYERCGGPYTEFTPKYNPAIYTDEVWKSDDTLNLPDVVVHPEHVGDVSEAIKFASQQKIGISVKTSGHSYTGSSTKKGTVLLHLSKLPKYSLDGSITECEVDQGIEGAYKEACDLAIARNKRAVIRVGGGQVWDEVLRSVSVNWNDDDSNSRKYHILSGAAGTVSAAGGWLYSGGLSGNNGMRMYGLGIDQVLHVEMVLPSGAHVRFGPTEWEKRPGHAYHLTKKVTGYCNMGNLSDEDSWDWQDCGDDIETSFHDLWYAVRGGGGGAYGVVTSIYYQLHDYLPMNSAAVQLESLDISPALRNDFIKAWIDFSLRFFYDPESVGVSESASNSCSSPDLGGFTGGTFICFDGGADIMKGAWERYLVESTNLTNPEEEYFTTFDKWSSWAHAMVDADSNAITHPNVPNGRARDVPAPYMLPLDPLLSYVMVPLDVVVNKREKLGQMIFDCYIEGTCLSGGTYIMGGMIPSVDDGMNSLARHRRHGAFLMNVMGPAEKSLALRESFYRLFYGVSDGDIVTGKDFPGILCHNHALIDFPTPLKENWAKNCDLSWSEEEKEEKCFSYQEGAWGTQILKNLENIHATVDPDRLFDCLDCVGYSKDSKDAKRSKGSEGTKKKSKKGSNKAAKNKRVRG